MPACSPPRPATGWSLHSRTNAPVTPQSLSLLCSELPTALCLTPKVRVMACDLALSPPDLSNPDFPPQRPHCSHPTRLAVSRTLQACSGFSVQEALPQVSDDPLLHSFELRLRVTFPVRPSLTPMPRSLSLFCFLFSYKTGYPLTHYLIYLLIFCIGLFQIV